MSPFYIKTSVCGSSQWKEVTGFYVKKNGSWCEVNEGHIKTSVCGDPSEWKLYYSNTKVQPGVILWTVDTSAPAGTVVANGSGVTAASNPTLHELLTNSGNLNSDGDPLFGGDLTTPLLPDIQGSNRFIRARSGNSSTTGVGVYQGYGIPSHYHQYRTYPGFGSGLQIPGPPSGYLGWTGSSAENLRVASINSTGEIGNGTALPNSGTETRPNNIAFLPVLGTEEISTVPVGSFVWWTSDTVPDGYLLCDGSAVTATYATLRTILIDAGNPFGTDGSNPRLPDLVTDNRFIRGAGGSLAHGTTQSHQLENHSHSYTRVTAQSIGDSGSRNAAQVTTYLSGPANGGNPGNETRPNAIALLPILKY
jgi:hypothetical protein